VWFEAWRAWRMQANKLPPFMCIHMSPFSPRKARMGLKSSGQKRGVKYRMEIGVAAAHQGDQNRCNRSSSGLVRIRHEH
jgi:hypothetical protein